MKALFFIPSPRLACLLLALGLSSCSMQDLPTVDVARPLAASDAPVSISDEAIAALLRNAAATPVAAGGNATEEFLLALQAKVHLHDWRTPLTIGDSQGAWRLSFAQNRSLDTQGKPEWTPSVFDRLLPASGFKLENYRQIYAGPGAGAPVILAFEDTATLRRERSFRPGNNVYVVGTAVLEFSKPARTGAPVPVRIRILNTPKTREVRIAGKTHPLAWNLTADVEANLNNPYITKSGLAGLRNAETHAEATGLFGINNYDPNKIPVVFVHGLNSDPHVWKSAVNELIGNPELNATYQPLLFMYPTGLPVPGAAARLRESLNEYRAKWDPDGNDANFDRMILVGHSMGGLLSRLQVIDSGDDLWKAFFTRPVSEVSFIPANDRKKVERTLNFKSQPFVERVIFVAVPHRGSQMADISIVRWGIKLIKLPKNLADYTANALLQDPALLNPALLQYNSLGLRSVDMLSPGHPYFKAIDARPIKVPYHAIIGDRGRNDSPKGSDGVVPFWSSYLDGAQSVKIVPHGHSCTGEPETVEEIIRILKLHKRGSAR